MNTCRWYAAFEGVCCNGNSEIMGGMLFDTAEEAAEVWNRRANG